MCSHLLSLSPLCPKPTRHPFPTNPTTPSPLRKQHHTNPYPTCLYSGKNLTIKASGTFSEDVEKGAYVNLQVKYGLIRLINQKADLCDQIKNVDLECPLKKGEAELTKDVELPKEIPPVCLSSFWAVVNWGRWG